MRSPADQPLFQVGPSAQVGSELASGLTLVTNQQQGSAPSFQARRPPAWFREDPRAAWHQSELPVLWSKSVAAISHASLRSPTACGPSSVGDFQSC